jgi:MFS family permease
MDANTAAMTEVNELGDIRQLVDQLDEGERGNEGERTNSDYLLYRVRPKPAFVVGIVIASIATAAGLLLAALGAIGPLSLPVGVLILSTGIAATGVAWIVGDSLAHETTTNHPVPERRAAGYFLATLLTVFGLEIGGLIALGALAVWAVVFPAVAVVAGIVLFTFLGATQTNRKKQWVRAAAREHQMQDRFSQDPVAAARFGIYTVVIWLLAFAAFVVLSIAVGFLWSWLALLGGFAVFMFVLARMLFPADSRKEAKPR